MGVLHPRKYTPEFKRQAVSLALELGSTPKAAERLGVPESNIHNWRVKLKADDDGSLGESLSSHRKSVPKESPEEENKRLRQEVSELKKVNHILKSAAAFFSQDHLK